MSFTVATLLFVPLAVWGARRTATTVVLLAATVGFSGTAVLNIPSLQFGVQPYHLFGAVLIVRAVLVARSGGNGGPASRRVQRAVGWLVLLWYVAVISAVVGTPGEAIGAVRAAQLGHLGFGIAVAWALCRLVRDPGLLARGCAGFEVGAVLCAGWAIVQSMLHLVGRRYPEELFNNSIGIYAQGFASQLPGTPLVRAAGVATEPSFLGRTLVIGLVLLLARHARGGLAERRWMAAGVVVIVSGIVLSTSTTAYFGLAAAVGVGLLAGRRLAVQRAVVVLVVAFTATVLFSPAFVDLIRTVTTDKVGGLSGQGRLATVVAARQVFTAHPWFGAGLGNVTSHDLLAKVLSNLGVVGAACLVGHLLTVLRGSFDRAGGTSVFRAGRALRFALVSSLAMDWVAGWSYTYGDVWIVIGLLLAALVQADVGAGRRSARDTVSPVASPHVPSPSSAVLPVGLGRAQPT